MFFSVFSDDANFIVWENVLIGFILVTMRKILFSFTVNENRIFLIVTRINPMKTFSQTMKSASLIKSIWMENFEKYLL